MDKDIALKAENISKRFGVDKNLDSKTLLTLFGKKKAFSGMNDAERIVDSNFWALRDINLEVMRGETLGIIGSNGAGKTTMLKIFSRILKQTTGTYTINGRVSSLIGVGTGFHQELSGRENVYFNGALLGMSKKEISDRFEEIVEFAEIGSFIDTPIKYYSSGMRSRLAFSVAMNLDAEIMIIDEALAVGDVAFKEKSSEKMRNTAFTGRTVLFVTHSMSFLQEVCTNSIVLDKGRMVAKGTTEEMVDLYLNKDSTRKAQAQWKPEPKEHIGNDEISFEKISLLKNGKKTQNKAAVLSDELGVSIEFHSSKSSKTYAVGYTLFDEAGRRLWRSNASQIEISEGKRELRSNIPTELLKPGVYYAALDSEKRGEGWVVDPKKTTARITFNLSGERIDILDVKKEGIIKPSIDWLYQ